MVCKNKEYDLLMFLFQCDRLRTSDFTLLATALYKKEQVSYYAIARLKEKGLIETVNYYSKVGKKMESITKITRKGRNLVSDTETDEYYNNNSEHLSKLYCATEPGEGAEENEKQESRLERNGIFAMFTACGIPVFTHDKPSLRYLIDVISGSEEPEAMAEYWDTLSREELRNLFLEHNGIFYSAKEVENCAKGISDIEDTIHGTKAKGIFISGKSCFVVYAAAKYKNKIVCMNQKGDKGLCNFLDAKLRGITNAYRVIPELEGYDHNFRPTENHDTSFKNEPYALILSDGNMLAYATATGFAKGKTTPKKLKFIKQMQNLSDSAKKKMEEKSGSGDNSLLTAQNSFFKKIYVVESSQNGIRSLRFVLHGNIETQIEDGKEAMSRNPEVFRENPYAANVYKYCEQTTGILRDVMYVPAFEAKELAAVAESDNTPVIVTYSDLMDKIAHSVRKECTFYDAEAMKLVGRDEVFIYNECGEIAGERVLDDYLMESGRTFDKHREGYELPRRLGMTRIAFYNALARGELNPADIVNEVEAKEIRKDTRDFTKRAHLSLYLTKEDKDQIARLAETQGLSISRYMMKEHSTFMQFLEAVRPDITASARGDINPDLPKQPPRSFDVGTKVIKAFEKFR